MDCHRIHLCPHTEKKEKRREIINKNIYTSTSELKNRVRVMDFNNISVISRRSVLLLEETGVP